MSGVEYHSNDFDFDSWRREAQEHILAGSSSEEDRESLTEASDLIYGDVWDDFYTQQGKSAYQVRRYIMEEFSSYFFGTSKSLKIIDVGAGVGSTAVALLRGLDGRISEYCATDCSRVGLEFLSSRIEGEGKATLELWDISSHPWPHDRKFDRVMCIFTLSAIHPHLHKRSLLHMASALNDGGCILFRDYAVFDMTMFRHKAISENLYQRQDRTLAYFFEKDKFSELVSSIKGLSLEENSYCCVTNVNRKTKQELKRVFLHAVIRKQA